jgi:hypothetical protein
MASASDLTSLGIPAEPALRLGFNVIIQAGVGTAQGGSAIHKSTTWVRATTTSGQTAFTLPADAELFSPYVVRNTTTDAALVFPPTGGQINNLTVNTGSASIAINQARIFYRATSTAWISFVTG